MWFSFSTNILIFATAIILYFLYRKDDVPVYYMAFVLLTGFSSFMAGFGHLPLIDENIRQVILYVSRLINFVSIFAFMQGTLGFFDYYQSKLNLGISLVILLSFVLWLSIYNVFTPVIIYSVIGLLIVGVASYLLNYEEYTAAANRVIGGIAILAVAAIIFSVFKSKDNTIAADIGHFLISAALIVLMTGFNKLTKNEIAK